MRHLAAILAALKAGEGCAQAAADLSTVSTSTKAHWFGCHGFGCVWLFSGGLGGWKSHLLDLGLGSLLSRHDDCDV